MDNGKVFEKRRVRGGEGRGALHRHTRQYTVCYTVIYMVKVLLIKAGIKTV